MSSAVLAQRLVKINIDLLIFQKRGSCSSDCAPCGKENNGQCSDCCISLSESCDCDCCKPSTDSCLDSVCPKNKVWQNNTVLALTVKTRKSQDFLTPISGSLGDQIFSLTFRNSTSIFLNTHLWCKTAILKRNNT